MAVQGIGIDIEDISRFRAIPYERNEKFYGKIFNEDEIKYCLLKVEPYQHFAVRFCAKEAFIKAISPNPGLKMINYKDIHIKLEKSKPVIIYRQKKYLLSLAHDKDKAIAVVIAMT